MMQPSSRLYCIKSSTHKDKDFLVDVAAAVIDTGMRASVEDCHVVLCTERTADSRSADPSTTSFVLSELKCGSIQMRVNLQSEDDFLNAL